MRYRHVTCTLDAFRASAVLPAPDGACSIDESVAEQLRDWWSQLSLHDEIRVATVTGSNGVFAVGRYPAPNDICIGPTHRRPEWIASMGVASAFAKLPMPTIAIINGDATGHGLELALAADLRVAADHAILGAGSLHDCEFPYDGATQRLPRLVGAGLARDMLFTGRTLSAREALDAGLVNRVVPAGELAESAANLADQIAAAAPVAARYAKEAVAASGDLTLQQGLGLEADLSVILQSTGDRAEGLRSFAEKSEPNFQGS